MHATLSYFSAFLCDLNLLYRRVHQNAYVILLMLMLYNIQIIDLF